MRNISVPYITFVFFHFFYPSIYIFLCLPLVSLIFCSSSSLSLPVFLPAFWISFCFFRFLSIFCKFFFMCSSVYLLLCSSLSLSVFLPFLFFYLPIFIYWSSSIFCVSAGLPFYILLSFALFLFLCLSLFDIMTVLQAWSASPLLVITSYPCAWESNRHMVWICTSHILCRNYITLKISLAYCVTPCIPPIWYRNINDLSPAPMARANVYLAQSCKILMSFVQYISGCIIPTWHHVGKLSHFSIYLPITCMIWVVVG
jgi:hypothetical protein